MQCFSGAAEPSFNSRNEQWRVYRVVIGKFNNKCETQFSKNPSKLCR